MKHELDNDKMMKRYLLGELSEEEQIQLEEQYFVDDELFEELLAVEDELIDDYVREELSAQEQERFEKHYLSSPQERCKVEFAKALEGYKPQAPKAAALTAARGEGVSWWQSLLELFSGNYRTLVPATATLIALIVIGGLWLRFAVQNQTEQAEQVAQQQDQRPPQVEEQPPNRPPQPEAEQPTQPVVEPTGSRRPEPRIATVVLTAGLVRGNEGIKELTIPRNADIVELRIDLERDDYRKYQAVVETPEGDKSWKPDSLKVSRSNSGKVVVLRIRARQLSKGEYIVTLSGATAGGNIEVIERYPFKVVKR